MTSHDGFFSKAFNSYGSRYVGKTTPILFTYSWNLQPKDAMVPLNVFQIVFEAQRGTGVGGEIGLDNVVLTSGPCQEDVGPIF